MITPIRKIENLKTYDFLNKFALNDIQKLFQTYIINKGIDFEDDIIKTIQTKFPNEFIKIINHKFIEYDTQKNVKSHKQFLETVYHIKKGTPIIYQGVLHDYENKIFGIPDLLVRSDWLNKLFNTSVINQPINSSTNIEPSNSINKWNYRVIEIKNNILNLNADGKTLRNSTKNTLCGKGQLYMYNKILGKIQNYTPSKSYILGKSTIYKKDLILYKGDSFDRVAHINFKSNDKFIRNKTALAIKWIRDVRSKGHSWKLFPASRDELKPNMCNNDDKWQFIKTQIANTQNDITSLWMCGINNRKCAEHNGVKNWRTHKNLTSEHLGITGDKTANTLQLILDYNQDPLILEPHIPYNELPNEYLIYPKKIKTKLFKWRTHQPLEFFIDFETISNAIVNLNKDSPDSIHDKFTGSLIFMVGVGYILNGEFKFECFIANGINPNSEYKIMIDMHNFIYNMSKKYSSVPSPRIWHWSHAEKTFYNETMCRHTIDNKQILSNWCDMLKIFKDEPIVTRNALNFSLKNIVGAFNSHGFININYKDSKVSNGLDAMCLAYNEYVTNKLNFSTSSIINDIKHYNEIDVKSLHEILKYLRNNH